MKAFTYIVGKRIRMAFKTNCFFFVDNQKPFYVTQRKWQWKLIGNNTYHHHRHRLYYRLSYVSVDMIDKMEANHFQKSYIGLI